MKLDQWRSRWSFAHGATKATARAGGQSLVELNEALAEVDGLLAGMNYLEKVEPYIDDLEPSSDQLEPGSDEPPSRCSSPSQIINMNDDASPSKPSANPWFGNLDISLPNIHHSINSAERSKMERKHLRKHLVGKLAKFNDNPAMPRDSQWATLRSLRKASFYYYHRFVEQTGASKSRNVRKLRKTYGTAKSLLEMGILTFREVLHGQIPTTLEQIFAFASLSYIISKSLYEKGHLEESDILSGLIDWRRVITDDKEQLAFDEIAQLLWPEAKEIMHFIPIQRSKGFRNDASELTDDTSNKTEALSNSASFSMPTGTAFTAEDQRPSIRQWDHEHKPFPPLDMSPESCLDDLETEPPDRIYDSLYHLIGETRSHEDFDFTTWLNTYTTDDDTPLDSTLHSTPPPYINPQLLRQHSSPTENSDISILPPNGPTKSSDLSLGHSPGEELGSVACHPTQDIRETTLFQIVLNFINQISETGDLLNILSGRQIMAVKNATNSFPLRQSWVEFLKQSPVFVLNPLYKKANSDKTFCGIIAMAETFVGLGLLRTVRDVENYIIDVGRNLALSCDLFSSLVSNTLSQCLEASRRMKWDLVYLGSIEEADEYSIAYIDRRKQGEKEWASTALAYHDPSRQPSPATSSIDEGYRKYPPNLLKHYCEGVVDPPLKYRRQNTPDIASQTPFSDSDTLAFLHCHYKDCPKYFKGTSAANNLSRHIRIDHEKRNILTCPSCSYKTGRRDNLRKHFLSKHSSCELPGWLASRERGWTNSRWKTACPNPRST